MTIDKTWFFLKKQKTSFFIFFTACLRGNLRIATLLVEKGADVNLVDDEHHTPLHLCSQVTIFRTSCTIIRSLFFWLIWHNGLTFCSSFFSQYGHAVLLNYLLQPRFNCDPHCITIYQDTPLHLACYNGHLSVRFLINNVDDMMAMQNWR